MPLTQREHEIIWRARQHYLNLLFECVDELLPDNPTPNQFTLTFELASKTIRNLIASDDPRTAPPADEPTNASPL